MINKFSCLALNLLRHKLFSEKRVIFQISGGAPGSGSAPTGPERTEGRPGERPEGESQRQRRLEAERRESGQLQAAETRQKILKSITQETFDQILDENHKSITLQSLQKDELELLMLFANGAEDNREDNFNKILERIESNEIGAEQLAVETIAILTHYFEQNTEALKTIFSLSLKTPRLIEYTIEACQTNSFLMNKILESLPEKISGKPTLQTLKAKTLAILITRFGLKKFMDDMTTAQKGELLNTNLDQQTKKTIFLSLLKIKDFGKIDLLVLGNMIQYAATENPSFLYEKIAPKLTKEQIHSLKHDAVKILLEAVYTYRHTSQKETYKKILDSLAPEAKAAIVQDPDFNHEIKEALWASMPEEARQEFPAPTERHAETRPEESPDQSEEARDQNEEATEELPPLEERLKQAGIELVEVDGKQRLVFYTEVMDEDTRKTLQIERSFKLTEDFRRLIEQEADPKEIKKLCYQRLLSITEDVAETNRHQVGYREIEETLGLTGKEQREKSMEILEASDKQMLQEIRSIDSTAETIQTFSELGVEFENPADLNKLSKKQKSKLTQSTKKLYQKISQAPDIYTLTDQVEEVGKQFGEILQGKINLLRFTKVTPTLIWRKDHNGFAEDKDHLTTLLEKIKKVQLADDPARQRLFNEGNSKRAIELRAEHAEESVYADYEENYESHIRNPRPIDHGIAEMFETRIVYDWENLPGSRRVDGIMTTGPFNLMKDQVPAAVNKMLASHGNQIYFDDVLAFLRPRYDRSRYIVPTSYLENANTFLSRLDDLKKKKDEGKLNTIEEHYYVNMMEGILKPCLELMEAISNLRTEETEREGWDEREDEKRRRLQEHRESLPEEQKQILEGLSTLCGFSERGVGAWERFIALIGGAHRTELTMQDIDGKTFKVDEGKFRRHTSPEVALRTLTNRQGLYTIGPDGQKIFNDQAITEEVNRLIELGMLNQFLGKTDEIGKPMTIRDIMPLIDAQRISSIKDFASFSEKQMLAFQNGYILDQISRSDEQIEEGIDTLVERPYFRAMVEDLIKKGVPNKVVGEIQERLLAGGGMYFENGEFRGGGAGISIPLSDGFSFQFGLAGNIDGDVVAGIGFTVEVFKTDGFRASFGMEFDLTGFSLGASQTTEMGEVNLHTFEGIRWNWANLIPTAGGSFGFSWNSQRYIDRQIAEAESGHDFVKAWEEWEKIPESDVQARLEALKGIPQIWASVAPLIEQFDLRPSDVVHMIEGLREDLTAKVLEETGPSPIPLISYIGFGMMGPIPVPQIGIHFGSAKIFIPNRRAISRMLSQLSDARTTRALEKAVEDLENGKTPTEFKEQTPDLILSRDGELLSLVQKDEINLSEWTTGVESYNEALASAEVKLEEVRPGVYKLKLLNPAIDKDIEMHLDPEVSEIGILNTGNKNEVYLIGDVENLIISRERFTLPWGGKPGTSSMRDIITIRRKESVQTGRDRTWIEQYEGALLLMREGEETFKRILGYNSDLEPQGNIMETKLPFDSPEVQAMISDFETHGTHLEGRLDASDIERMKSLLQARFEAMKSMTVREYEGLPVRPDLYEKLDELFAKEGFKDKLKKVTDDPGKVIRLIEAEAASVGLTDLNVRELNLAAHHLTNSWFTTVYPGPDVELTPKERQKLNKKIKKGLLRRKKFLERKVFNPAFSEAVERIQARGESISLTGAAAAEQLVNDTYNPLLQRLDQPDFDFRDLKTEDIPEGALLLSGSRMYDKSNHRVGAIAEFINYDTLPQAEGLIHEFGFLEGTTDTYSLQDPETKDMARILLETASPLPQEDLEFLRSPLALKISSLGVHLLLAGEADYQLITEIYADPSKLESAEHREAFTRFRKLIEDIRAAQISGQIFEQKNPETELTVQINMQTNIERGLYSKCGNGSFFVEEVGQVTVLKGAVVLSQYTESTEVTDVTQAKLFASIGLGIGFKTVKRPTRRPGRKPHRTHRRPRRRKPHGTYGGETGSTEIPTDSDAGGTTGGTGTGTGRRGMRGRHGGSGTSVAGDA